MATGGTRTGLSCRHSPRTRCCRHCRHRRHCRWSPTTTTSEGTPLHGLTVPSNESPEECRDGPPTKPCGVGQRHQHAPSLSQRVGGRGGRGALSSWSSSLIATVAQAYPTPEQEEQVRIHAHCPVEQIPAAIVVVVDVAVIDPLRRPPPSPLQQRGNRRSPLAVWTTKKIDHRPESAFH
jgi:hypothetical protein